MRTLGDYMRNPSGTKSAAIANRQMYQDLYQNKWGAIMTRENGHLDYTLYRKGNTYVAHLLVPSETVDKFYYDVVFKMVMKDSSRSLDDAVIEFFSNDPAFNYTWAYAFTKHKLCIPELKSKMSKIALKRQPHEKNPDNMIGYVKTIYFAYIYLKSKGLLNKLRFETEAKTLDWKHIEKLIMDTEDKISARQEEGEKIQQQKKKEQKRDIKPNRKDLFNPEVHSNSSSYHIKKVDFTGHIHKTKRAGSMMRASGVKHSKKVGKK